MKKISLIALALSTSMAMFAQNTEPKLRTDMARTVRFGIKAGINNATMRPGGYSAALEPKFNRKTSMHGGVFVNIPLGTGNLAFQPELLYNGQGGKYKASSGGLNPTTVSYEQDLHYLSLPLMFQLKTTGGFYVELGPQVSYLMKATMDNGTTDVKNTDKFDNFDFAATGGLGYMTRIGLGIGARYNHSWSNSLEDGGGNNSSNNGPELKNRVIAVGLFYQFGAYK